MRLGLQLGYWGAGPPTNAAELVSAAERHGFAAVFAAESWGSDAFTPLAWWGSATRRVALGTSVAQLSARSPTACAMHALTLDHLSGGRAILGLGVSGPQVVEGWYGAPFTRPLARTREYISIVRQVLARQEPVRADGPHYPLPYRGPGAEGLGKSLRSITHPLRADLPIWLGAEGPRNVALAAELADGWLAVYFSASLARQYNEWLDEGFARPSARRDRADFEIAAGCQVVITEDAEEIAAAYTAMKPILALYIGGMGAPEKNFHASLFSRMGFAAEVADVSRYFLAGKRAEAAAAVPDELVREVAFIGSANYVRERAVEWAAYGVTMLQIGCRDIAQVARVAEVLGEVPTLA
ncbi:F420-dependent oxidoreductase-like protein [Tamaricihabitans halophyticus]|uniref:F420-dependent oxidoreductase-like protein n=1 Tax=Tamaricihabitans halophyticus TaxID=1262583 RepID=A0A4R2QAV4_9PSEU|nr:LLM class F420-dependent oxidoreductase [Tamaricihabitans halophyticus]TCP45374.1 F420-dependent oxidoreductase-like protein [Tamaricihabitans halophyticus]